MYQSEMLMTDEKIQLGWRVPSSIRDSFQKYCDEVGSNYGDSLAAAMVIWQYLLSTHHSGTFTGRHDTVSFSGDSTTFVPVREPDKYIPCTTKVISGLLFVRTYP